MKVRVYVGEISINISVSSRVTLYIGSWWFVHIISYTISICCVKMVMQAEPQADFYVLIIGGGE